MVPCRHDRVISVSDGQMAFQLYIVDIYVSRVNSYYLFLYTYIHTYIHTNIHTYIHTLMSTWELLTLALEMILFTALVIVGITVSIITRRISSATQIKDAV